MRWFSNPQRDSREAIRAAQQALIHAGYPHAVAEFETYLYRACGRRWPRRATPSGQAS